jgi:hypothetical protein
MRAWQFQMLWTSLRMIMQHFTQCFKISLKQELYKKLKVLLNRFRQQWQRITPECQLYVPKSDLLCVRASRWPDYTISIPDR